MKVLRSIQEVRGYRAGKGDLALVPTMGAFHDGHVELMRRARKDFDDVCVSLFVNPAQFGPNEDFAAYPRDEARDFEVAKQAGVGAIFAPSVEEMAMDTETRVVVKGVSELWEGEARPGHFEGVATVVLKLFNIVGPTAAYFGLKDLQQCSVIKKMCKDLDVDIDIRLVETVREPSGLAMSSRNAYFDQIQRAAAAKMFHTMQSAVTSAKDSGSSLREVESKGLASLVALGFEPDYLAFVDQDTMQVAQGIDDKTRLVCAAKFCGVRLIDNIAVC